MRQRERGFAFDRLRLEDAAVLLDHAQVKPTGRGERYLGPRWYFREKHRPTPAAIRDGLSIETRGLRERRADRAALASSACSRRTRRADRQFASRCRSARGQAGDRRRAVAHHHAAHRAAAPPRTGLGDDVIDEGNLRGYVACRIPVTARHPPTVAPCMRIGDQAQWSSAENRAQPTRQAACPRLDEGTSPRSSERHRRPRHAGHRLERRSRRRRAHSTWAARCAGALKSAMSSSSAMRRSRPRSFDMAGRTVPRRVPDLRHRRRKYSWSPLVGKTLLAVRRQRSLERRAVPTNTRRQAGRRRIVIQKLAIEHRPRSQCPAQPSTPILRFPQSLFAPTGSGVPGWVRSAGAAGHSGPEGAGSAARARRGDRRTKLRFVAAVRIEPVSPGGPPRRTGVALVRKRRSRQVPCCDSRFSKHRGRLQRRWRTHGALRSRPSCRVDQLYSILMFVLVPRTDDCFVSRARRSAMHVPRRRQAVAAGATGGRESVLKQPASVKRT